MTGKFRPYNPKTDYEIIGTFLSRHFMPGNEDGNWIQPAWEYMHFHPSLDRSSLKKIAIWERGDEIIGIANYESQLGEAFFQFHPDHRSNFQVMLEYAEHNLFGTDLKNGTKYLYVFVNENHKDFISFVKQQGYSTQEGDNRAMALLPILPSMAPVKLPEGFRFTSLAEECDWEKVNRVLWRGFDHPGDAPFSENILNERKRMFDTPSARRELKVIVRAPNGNFACLCGLFYEPLNEFAYIEPLATDPDFRRLGLARAAVMEGLRRSASLGAKHAYVWNDLPFYKSLGFKVTSTTFCWKKELK